MVSWASGNACCAGVWTARRSLRGFSISAEGIAITCEPDMANLTIGEADHTAIRFTISVVDAASVPHSKEALQ
jgi:stage V sporulation protein SpoVS